MRIESLAARPDRAGRCTVLFSDGTKLRLYPQTVEDFGLYTGLELTEEQMKQLRDATGQMSAKMRAVRIVAASNVSRQDLQERLVRKGETPRQAREAVAWMEELNLVDDEKTAALIVERCIARGYGLERAKQALYEKRIPKALWDKALEEYPDQQDKIREFLEGRLGDDWDARDLKRAVDALMRRGHSYRQIRRALESMNSDLDGLMEEA